MHSSARHQRPWRLLQPLGDKGGHRGALPASRCVMDIRCLAGPLGTGRTGQASSTTRFGTCRPAMAAGTGVSCGASAVGSSDSTGPQFPASTECAQPTFNAVLAFSSRMRPWLGRDSRGEAVAGSAGRSFEFLRDSSCDLLWLGLRSSAAKKPKPGALRLGRPRDAET